MRFRAFEHKIEPMAWLRRVVVGVGCAWLGATSAACWDFGFTPDAPDAAVRPDTGPTPEAGRDAEPPKNDAGGDSAPSPCVVGGMYCGGPLVSGPGDTLFRCTGPNKGELVAKCANGCFAENPPVGKDVCRPPTPCEVGGFYCGGDKVNGDPGALYKCDGNRMGQLEKKCPNGCKVAAAGADDYCF